MNIIYLITGSNIGDRKKKLQVAAGKIKNTIGPINKSSAIYETAAWGDNNQPDFYNQVHVVESHFSAAAVMQKILKIEAEMGRIRTTKNAARVIDIDILFFNNEIINEPGLIVPHPEISNRRFVLMPLKELNPSLVHPSLRKTIRELLASCEDPLSVALLLSPT